MAGVGPGRYRHGGVLMKIPQHVVGVPALQGPWQRFIAASAAKPGLF